MTQFKKAIETHITDSLDRFTDELFEWSKKGILPDSASGELRYVLDCQKKRLKKFGMDMEQEIAHTENEIRGDLAKKGSSISADTIYREAVSRTMLRKGEKKIFERKMPITFYATRLEKEGSSDRMCTCPNCGKTAPASVMRSGCPNCGTVFEIEDVIPVFSSYYSVPAIVERAKFIPSLKKVMTLIFICATVLMTVLFWITEKDLPVVFRLLLSLFYGGFIGGFITFTCYLAYSATLLFKVFWEAGRSLPLLKGIRTSKKLEEAIKGYDPDFSYPYFEGRLISLFRAIAFSEEREKLSIYEGDEDLSFLDPLVDIQYRGASQLLSFKQEDGILKAKLKIFMNDLRYDGRFRSKDENYIITMERDIDTGRGHDFDLTKVQCHSCGASFDALHQKNCPFCGTRYHLRYDDWMITSIKKA